MSGIYIPSMEMPTTGLYLVSVDNSCGEDETVMTVKCMLGNRDVCKIIGAYNLVPVPEHGRLIDADALLESDPGYTIPNYNSDGYLADSEGAYTDVQIENAPTIIPADLVKEGEE